MQLLDEVEDLVTDVMEEMADVRCRTPLPTPCFAFRSRRKGWKQGGSCKRDKMLSRGRCCEQR